MNRIKNIFYFLISVIGIPFLLTNCNNQVDHFNDDSFEQKLAPDISFKMIKVQGVLFKMGAQDTEIPGAEPDETPSHLVYVNSFYMSECEITLAQWTSVMGETRLSQDSMTYEKYKDSPVINVSWYDIMAFLYRLNQMTGENYRLPTEAEWEFAAKGGVKSKGFVYSGSNDIDSVAWYIKNSGLVVHPIKQKMPNELGLYDMSGNASEWCYDWYGDYPNLLQFNPTGVSIGYDKVVRGGCWQSTSIGCRVTDRAMTQAMFNSYYSGFRVVLSL